LSLAEVIELARALGCADRLRILGVQVGDVRPGRFLSPRVRESVPEVIARIREEVEALS
jgi:Ni,Fe-hydrogenase maturation factor